MTVEVGIKGGLSMGRFKNYSQKESKLSDVGGQFSFKMGGGAGLVGKMWFNKFVGIGAAAEFNQGGNIAERKTYASGGLHIYNRDTRLNYITIPVVAHVGWGNDRLRVYGTVGGYYAFAINGKDKVTEEVDNILLDDYEVDADFDNVYKRHDYGIRFGVGTEVIVSENMKHAITFDMTYDWGFGEVYHDGYTTDKYHITNSRTLIHVGYVYRFGNLKTDEGKKK
ncbi:MAG: porin family protein [Chitinophagales bacterium]